LKELTKCVVSVTLTALMLVAASSASAVDLYQLADFEDGTVMGWNEGSVSPNPPINVPDGGPWGSGDAYLENTSSGGTGAGARMVMFNNTQWAGDFSALRTNLKIRVDMVNLGMNPLTLRVGLEGANGARYATSTGSILPPDGIWFELLFDLTDADMTLVEGSGTLDSVLDNVVEMRILSSGSPSWRGDAVQGVLGVDKIEFMSLVFWDGFESGDLLSWSSFQ